MTRTWTVIPLSLPTVRRRCPRCDAPRPFCCSEKFRVNANKKRVDVWLIYRCDTCDATWNRPIARRATVAELGDDYERFCRNDGALAARYAFEAASASDRRTPFTIDEAGEGTEIVLRLTAPLSARLDRVLAIGLGVSRSSLRRWFDRGALRRPIRDGQSVDITPARDDAR